MNRLKRAKIDWDNLPELKKAYYEQNPDEEVWMNDLYTVYVRRGLPLNNDSGITVCHLSIKRNDREAGMDWRHMQMIKNQLVGEEHEGCEIFPSEKRLVDGSNQYHLWVFEDKNLAFPFGFSTRHVSENMALGNKQRPFDVKPEDLGEYDEAAEAYLKSTKTKK